MDTKQKFCKRVLERHRTPEEWIYEAAIGLASEGGECVHLVRRELFDGKPFEDGEMLLEMCDVMHFLALGCAAYGITLEELAKLNMIKMDAMDGGVKRFFEGLVKNIDVHNMSNELDAIACEVEERRW